MSYKVRNLEVIFTYDLSVPKNSYIHAAFKAWLKETYGFVDRLEDGPSTKHPRVEAMLRLARAHRSNSLPNTTLYHRELPSIDALTLEAACKEYLELISKEKGLKKPATLTCFMLFEGKVVQFSSQS